MTTYSSHRLVMGKEKIDNFLSHKGYLDFFYKKMFLSSQSSTFRTTFVQIGESDLLSGRQKGSIFLKMFKNLLRNHKEDEAETWHTC